MEVSHMSSRFPDWFFFALVTLVLWGFWGFLPAIAAKYIGDARSILFYSMIGSVAVALVVFVSMGFKPEFHARGIVFAILTGICETVGILLYMYAVSRGPGHLSLIVTTTGLYPIVTVILALTILRDKLTTVQGIGIALALSAIVLINWPTSSSS